MSNSKYSCKECNYFTNIKQNYDKHLLSKKHNAPKKSEDEQKQYDEQCKFICSICNKKYKCYSGLWNHKKKCKEVKKQQLEKQSPALKEVILLKGKIDKQSDENKELKNESM